MKKLILFTSTLIVLLSVGCSDTTDPDDEIFPTFELVYGDESNDYCHSAVHTADGGYILAGFSINPVDGHSNVYVVKTDSEGVLIWENTIGGELDIAAKSIYPTADGGYLLAGTTQSSGITYLDILTLKIDSLGEELWMRIYSGDDNDEAYSVIETNSGGIALFGYTESAISAGSFDAFMLLLDGDGNEELSRAYGGKEPDAAYSAIESFDGKFVLAGFTNSAGSGEADAWIIKTTANGTPLWDKIYGSTGDDIARDIKQTSDGGYIIAGHTNSTENGDYQFWIAKLDYDGDFEWDVISGGENDDRAYSIIESFDGGFVAVGDTDPGNGLSDIMMMKISSTGALLWTRTYGGTGLDAGRNILQASDAGYLIAGYSDSHGDGTTDFYFTKTDPDGYLVE